MKIAQSISSSLIAASIAGVLFTGLPAYAATKAVSPVKQRAEAIVGKAEHNVGRAAEKGSTVHKVDINVADAKTIADAVKGFGDKRAADIVAYREANGPFKSLDELVKVKGIGKKFMEKTKQHLEDTLTVG